MRWGAGRGGGGARARRYGFRRQNKGGDAGAYHHSHFLRGRPELLEHIRRGSSKLGPPPPPTAEGAETRAAIEAHVIHVDGAEILKPSIATGEAAEAGAGPLSGSALPVAPASGSLALGIKDEEVDFSRPFKVVVAPPSSGYVHPPPAWAMPMANAFGCSLPERMNKRARTAALLEASFANGKQIPFFAEEAGAPPGHALLPNRYPSLPPNLLYGGYSGGYPGGSFAPHYFPPEIAPPALEAGTPPYNPLLYMPNVPPPSQAPSSVPVPPAAAAAQQLLHAPPTKRDAGDSDGTRGTVRDGEDGGLVLLEVND